jgi:hypothetical protein
MMRTRTVAGIVATAVVLLGSCNSTSAKTENTTRVLTVDSSAIATAPSSVPTVTAAQIRDAPGVPISTAPAAPPASGIQTQNANLTPGLTDPAVTQADIQTTICVTGYTSTVRAVTAETRANVYREYGITTPTSGTYEIDHLIPLELGGSNDIGNLWPEPATGVDDSHAKDRWENALHSEVCAGTVTLPVAQDEMVHWWVLIGAVANPTTVTSSGVPRSSVPTASSASTASSVPTSSSAPIAPPAQTDQSTTQPPAAETAPVANSGAIKPGAFCDPVGAGGTYDGANYVCSTTSATGTPYKGDRAHWRRG